MLLQPKKLKPGRKALNDVLVHVVNALMAPNRRDGLKFGIFIVRTKSCHNSQSRLPLHREMVLLFSCNTAVKTCSCCACGVLQTLALLCMYMS